MSEADAFLKAVIESPDEDTPRLAFADWLDEHGGDPDRAEFIRIQCELARLPDDAPGRAGLEVRERVLLARHVARWASPWPEFEGGEYAGEGPLRAVFRRGFLEAFDTHGLNPGAPGPFTAYARLFAVHPIREVTAWGANAGDLHRVAGWEQLRRVESFGLWLNLTGHGPAGQPLLAEAAEFLRSPHLTRLRRLSVSLSRSARETLPWLGLPVMRRLVSLRDPVGFPSDGESLDEFARGGFDHLRELEFASADSPAYARAADRFVRSEVWGRLTAATDSGGGRFPWKEGLANARLRRLSLQLRSAVVPEFVDAAEAYSGPPTLEELRLQGHTIHGEHLSRLLATPAVAGLRRLTFEHAQLTDDDLDRLAASPVLGRLNRLCVWLRHDVSARGLERLLAADLSRVTHLRVYGAPVRVSAVEALAANPAARRLRVLAFNWDSPAAALTALTRGEPFPDLHTIQPGYWNPPPDPKVLDDFLYSPNLPRLCAVLFSVDFRHAAKLGEVFRGCGRLAWAGGEMADGGDGVRVAAVPQNVYLPNHLDDFGV